MKAVLGGAFAAAVLAACCLAQQPSAAEFAARSRSISAPATTPLIRVSFNDPGLLPSHWTLTLHPDGTGHFHSPLGGPANDPSSDLRTPGVNRDIRLSPRFAAHAFEVARQHRWFEQACESHRKVAFQGWKTLAYSSPGGSGSCTFNYSNDKSIENLGESFLAISQTILEGARLKLLLDHDPLGLEQEIEGLSAEVEDGRAQQVCVIEGILKRLAEDDNVMEMVRKRARLLLTMAEKS